MTTQYHIFLGEIASSYSNVIASIGVDTSGDSSYVINVVKMYKTWANKMNTHKHLVENIKNIPYNQTLLTLSDTYWVHKALEQGLQQHGINDSSVNNIISLCELIIKHLEELPESNIDSMHQVGDFIETKYINTLSYLITLSIKWCLEKKIPIISMSSETNDKSPTVKEVYESVSYYCG